MFKLKSLLPILLYYLSLRIRSTSAECWTCQVDDDCLDDDDGKNPTTSNNNNSSSSNNATNTTTLPSSSRRARICDQDLQLCVHQDTNLRDIDCPCSNGEDCESGRCEGINLSLQGTCHPRLEINEECNEDSDCISGICDFSMNNFSFGVCQQQQENQLLDDGMLCFSNDDVCNSGRCVGLYLSSTCQPQLLENGIACLTNDECNSGRCDDDMLICRPRFQSNIGIDCIEDYDCTSMTCLDFVCVDGRGSEEDVAEVIDEDNEERPNTLIWIIVSLIVGGGCVGTYCYDKCQDEDDDKKGGYHPDLPLEIGDAVLSRNTIDRGDGGATTAGGGGDCPNPDTAAATTTTGGGGGGDCDCCGGCEGCCDCCNGCDLGGCVIS